MENLLTVSSAARAWSQTLIVYMASQEDVLDLNLNLADQNEQVAIGLVSVHCVDESFALVVLPCRVHFGWCVFCSPQPATIATTGAALANFDSEDMDDLIVELEKDEAFTMDVRMRFEETVAALQKGVATEG